MNRAVTNTLTLSLLLHPRHARAILNGQELFLKYGWLPNGTAFHVVEPPGGVRVTSAGILIARHSINELVRNEERAKKAQEIQKMGKWYCPCPVEWLKKKEWSVLTAMMLFAGLNPKWSDLTWDTHGKCAEAKHIERIGWEYSYKDAGYALLSKEQLEKDLISIRKEAEENLNQRRQEIRAFGINVHSAQILAQYRTPK